MGPSGTGLRLAIAAAAVATILASGNAVARKLPRVALIDAEQGAIVREVSLTGSLTSSRWARLAPEVDGRVTAIAVDAGDRVDAGAGLLQLDAELARIELEQAAAARREAEASLANARRRLREARDLAARDSIGRSELEARRAEAERLEAVLARREAERAYQAELLDRHRLEAPFAGVINRRMVDIGERATPESPVLELVATGRLRLDVEVPQQYFGTVEPGTDVRIRVDPRPDDTIDERIDTIVPVSNRDSRTFRARVNLDNADGHLMPGMSARATLRIDTGRTGVVIPQDALIRHPDGRTVVWIAEGDGDERIVRERRVKTGLKFDGRIAIRNGLQAGAAVVTEGNEALQDGQQVRVTGAE